MILARWLAIAADLTGEHAVLSDGWHHIRLDIEEGSLASRSVMLQFTIAGLSGAAAQILPLRRLLHLSQHGRFAASLFPADAGIARGLVVLRVRDALDDGASQRMIASVLYGDDRVDLDWRASSDSLRSRVRRMVADARALARGGWRRLMARRGNGAVS
ncbi:DNA -binding domain-containing protein [Sphingomonas sp. 1P08PE]|uniref:DNA -binding domain-containing protein n=1 Tax=Sphingomonas sp. 1P08PE TaxID=554122 RepID=UPI0039A312AA